jgi:peptidoglycan/xylan/chitin deacetylase (PgdA/CDA1 family)
MNRPFGLMFHHFHGGLHKPDTANSLSEHQFEKILLYIGVKNILSPDQWIAAAKDGELKPSYRCLTFDDGLKNQFDIALPVLQKYKLKAFWFVYSAQYEGEYPRLDIFRRFRYHHYDDIEDYYKDFFSQTDITILKKNSKYEDWKNTFLSIAPFYSENDLKYRYARDVLLGAKKYYATVEKIIKFRGLSLADLTSELWLKKSDLHFLSKQGHALGMHSYDHPTDLKKLNELEQRKQYTQNMIFIKKFTPNPISMSHPCNSYDELTLKILSQIGVKVGFRANMSQKNIFNFQKNLQFPREDAANILRSLKNMD